MGLEEQAVLAQCCCGLLKATPALQSYTHTQMHSLDRSHALFPASMSLQSHTYRSHTLLCFEIR